MGNKMTIKLYVYKMDRIATNMWKERASVFPCMYTLYGVKQRAEFARGECGERSGGCSAPPSLVRNTR